MTEIRFELKELGIKNRYIFTAEIGRISQKPLGRKMKNILLLKNLKQYGADKILCENLWFDYNKRLEMANFKEGDIISFYARIKEYEKGYCGDREYFHWLNGIMPLEPTKDYKLVYPCRIRIEQSCIKRGKRDVIFGVDNLKISANDNRECLQKTNCF